MLEHLCLFCMSRCGVGVKLESWDGAERCGLCPAGKEGGGHHPACGGVRRVRVAGTGGLILSEEKTLQLVHRFSTETGSWDF